VNVLFISHCNFRGNSAIHIFSIANQLSDLGVNCVVCVPDDESTVTEHGTPKFTAISYANAYAAPVVFPNGQGADVIHAWTPRELVRKLTLRLAVQGRAKYVVHLEDNEDVILETELGTAKYAELYRLTKEAMDEIVPTHRSHPLRYREFLASASGVTAVIDRLLEFKPSNIPGLVFWPGFDPQFLNLDCLEDSRRQYGFLEKESVLVYNGNIHETNASEVRSLFLAVQALRRSGRHITLLKTGGQYIAATWIQEAVENGAVLELGFLPRSRLYSILRIADVLVQPGRAGRFNDYRFPSKLPEFFASGKPVILPRTNLGLSVRDSVEAMLLDSGDAIEIAQKIELILDDASLAARIGAAGKQFAIERLSWSKNVPALKDFYARLR